MKDQDKIILEDLAGKLQEEGGLPECRAARECQEDGEKRELRSEAFINKLLLYADAEGVAEARFVLEKDRLVFIFKDKSYLKTEDDGGERKGKLEKWNLSSFAEMFPLIDSLYICPQKSNLQIEQSSSTAPLQDDLAGGGDEETEIVFNFSKNKDERELAYKSLKDVLENLLYPALFLDNLRKIFYKIDNEQRLYDKRVEYLELNGDIKIDLLKMRKSSRDDPAKMLDERLWLFSRQDRDGARYGAGFFIDREEKLLARSLPVFACFPTRENAGLNFIINAPFLLDREGRLADNMHNPDLLDKLAALAADSLECLKELGIRSDVRVIDDNILDLVPTDPALLEAEGKCRLHSYLPFYEAILDKFKNSALLPCREGYTDSRHAWLAASPELVKLFPVDKLRSRLGDDRAEWVFPSLDWRELQKNNPALFQYALEICGGLLNADEISGQLD